MTGSFSVVCGVLLLDGCAHATPRAHAPVAEEPRVMAPTSGEEALPELDPTKELEHAKDVYTRCIKVGRSIDCRSLRDAEQSAAPQAAP